jgi:hypothetical protein
MTEAEWLACLQPDKMLRSLPSGRLTPRKLRLFACACVRRIWHLLDHDPLGRECIEMVEQVSDGIVDGSAYLAWYAKVMSTYDYEENDAEETVDENRIYQLSIQARTSHAIAAAEGTVYDYLQDALVTNRRQIQRQSIRTAQEAAQATASVIAVIERQRRLNRRRPSAKMFRNLSRSKLPEPEREGQSRLIRDLFGNPFRPLPSLAPRWLSWNDGIVLKLAESIYQESAFDRLGILADALEEAGCASADILAHCRQPGEHARGCWAIDLLHGNPYR